MFYVSYEELHKMIADGRIAFDYAWRHFEELQSRPATYKLYGPPAPGIGAASPCSAVKRREKELRKATRREKYVLYELDEKYQLIRNSYIEKYNSVHCMYHHFEINDIQYAVPFFRGEKLFYESVVHSVKYCEGKPMYYADLYGHRIFVEFYEYISDERVAVTCYDYCPDRKLSWCMEPVSFDAPYGASNSPIILNCFEMPSPCIDFSKWFTERRTGGGSLS